jgi:hypothetical protein
LAATNIQTQKCRKPEEGIGGGYDYDYGDDDDDDDNNNMFTLAQNIALAAFISIY